MTIMTAPAPPGPDSNPKNLFRKAIGKYLILEFDECTLPFEITRIVGLRVNPNIERDLEKWRDSNIYGIINDGETVIPIINKTLPFRDPDIYDLPRTVLVTEAKCFSCTIWIGILTTMGKRNSQWAYSLAI